MLVVIATDKDKPTIINQPTVSRGEDILVLYHFIKREREEVVVVEVEVEVVYDEVVSVEVYHVWLPGHRPTVPR